MVVANVAPFGHGAPSFRAIGAVKGWKTTACVLLRVPLLYTVPLPHAVHAAIVWASSQLAPLAIEFSVVNLILVTQQCRGGSLVALALSRRRVACASMRPPAF